MGYWVGYSRFAPGITEKTAKWSLDWVGHTLLRGFFDMEEFPGVLGRSGFAAQILEYDRPLLRPLYAWSVAAPSYGWLPLPGMHTFTLAFLARNLTRRRLMSSLDDIEERGEFFNQGRRASHEVRWSRNGGLGIRRSP